MALFVLRKGFRVETTPTGGRVVHERTKDEMPLTAVEVQLLARATNDGVDTDDESIKPVIKKLAGLGLLTPSAANPTAPTITFKAPPVAATPSTPSGLEVPPGLRPRSVPEPAPSPGASAPSAATTAATPTALAPTAARKLPEPEELAPIFRADLQIQPKEGSDLVEVSDPVSGKKFTLYEFEVSLARMLSGTRRYGDVVEGGERLGIPVTLESLSQFVRQLERYGFLAPPGSPPATEAQNRATRRRWDEGLRSLYQSGIRLHRQGRYAEARAYFEAMLQKDPANDEARDMVVRCQKALEQRAANAAAAPLEPAVRSTEGLSELLAAETGEDLANGPSEQAASPESEGEPQVPPEEAAADAAAGETGEGTAPPAPYRPQLLSPGALPPRGKVARDEDDFEGALRASHSRRRKLGLGLAATAALAASLYTNQAALLKLVGRAPSPSAPPGLPAPQPAFLPGAGAGALPRPPAPGVAPLPPVGQPVAPPTATSPNGNAPQPGAATATPTPAQTTPGATPDGPPTSAANEVPDKPLQLAVNAASGSSPEAPPSQPDTAPSVGGPLLEIVRRGRVTMGSLKAPAAGKLEWTASAEQRVRRGDSLGILLAGSKRIALSAPISGLVMPAVATGDNATKGQLVVNLAYHEAFLQTLVEGPAKPNPTWACEVVEESLGTRAPCRVTTVAPKQGKHLVTVVAEPTWVDKAAGVKLRLAPAK